MKNTDIIFLNDVVEMTGYSKSWLYKATMKKQIPHYKRPGGRKLFFKKSEIEQWLTANREATIEEMAKQ